MSPTLDTSPVVTPHTPHLCTKKVARKRPVVPLFKRKVLVVWNLRRPWSPLLILLGLTNLLSTTAFAHSIDGTDRSRNLSAGGGGDDEFSEDINIHDYFLHISLPESHPMADFTLLNHLTGYYGQVLQNAGYISYDFCDFFRNILKNKLSD